MTEEAVNYELHDRVAVVRLEDPGTRNALSTSMLEGVVLALDRAADEARVAVVTGGSQVFASGADLRELREQTPSSYLNSPRRAAWERLHSHPLPTVAAVAGYALGGGCELALTCDLVVAADDARLGQPEVRLGIIPGAGGTQRWARVVGRHRAAEIGLTGRWITSWEARRLGIVNKVVPAERLLHAAIELAETIATFAPLATRGVKEAIRVAEEMPLEGGLAHERLILASLLATEDSTEGIDAFLDKRPPTFRGR